MTGKHNVNLIIFFENLLLNSLVPFVWASATRYVSVIELVFEMFLREFETKELNGFLIKLLMHFEFIPNHLDDAAKPCQSSQNPEKHTNAVNIEA